MKKIAIVACLLAMVSVIGCSGSSSAPASKPAAAPAGTGK